MGRSVSSDEAALMSDLRQQGISLNKIGHRLNRTAKVVQYHAEPQARERLKVNETVGRARRLARQQRG
jgi:hypothetical protein